MNKLLLVEDINIINDGTYFLELNKSAKVEIAGLANCYHVNNLNHNLDIKVSDESKFIFHKLDYVTSDTNLNIAIHNNSEVELNWLIINHGINKVTLNVEMLGVASFAKLRVRILNTTSSDYLDFICNGVVGKNTSDNELLEDLKGLITSNDEIKISPNIEVYTSEVMANHLVTIGTYNKDDLFYLESKCISDALAKRLIIDGYVNEVSDEILKKYIKMEVINIE